MQNLYDIYYKLNAEERVKFVIKNPRYAIIYKGKEVKRYPFLRQAKQFKMRYDSILYSEIVDIVDVWTGEKM